MIRFAYSNINIIKKDAHFENGKMELFNITSLVLALKYIYKVVCTVTHQCSEISPPPPAPPCAAVKGTLFFYTFLFSSTPTF